LQPSYAIGVDAFVLVYSVTNRKSFELIPVIYEKIVNTVGTEKVPFIIVGNKCELEKQRIVTELEGKQLALKLGSVFLEVSAKRNYQINSIFSEAFEQICLRKPEKNQNCIIC
jgi:Ras homolog enriched in brain